MAYDDNEGGYGGRQRRDSGSRSSVPLDKPVKVGEEHDVTIDAVGTRGDGICKISNFVVFVPGVQAGQAVKIRITSVRERFATAEVVA